MRDNVGDLFANGEGALPIRSDSATVHAAATAHADAAPRTKRYAALMGVSERTARNHRSVKAAQGSPLRRYWAYLDAVDDPYRIEAATRSHLKMRKLKSMTDDELIARIRHLEQVDALDEGADNRAKVTRGVSALERAALAERDGASDIERAAAWRLIHERGLTDADVYGGGA
jgi:hypothetical protein